MKDEKHIRERSEQRLRGEFEQAAFDAKAELQRALDKYHEQRKQYESMESDLWQASQALKQKQLEVSNLQSAQLQLPSALTRNKELLKRNAELRDRRDFDIDVLGDEIDELVDALNLERSMSRVEQAHLSSKRAEVETLTSELTSLKRTRERELGSSRTGKPPIRQRPSQADQHSTPSQSQQQISQDF